VFNNFKTRIVTVILISLIIFSGFIGTKNAMAEKTNTEVNKKTIQTIYKNENNIVDDSVVISKHDQPSNYKISKQKGLEIVISKVKIETGLHILYDSERNIKGRNYHLYTINTNEYTFDEYAYCVDVESGKLFKCSKDMTLLPIK